MLVYLCCYFVRWSVLSLPLLRFYIYIIKKEIFYTIYQYSIILLFFYVYTFPTFCTPSLYAVIHSPYNLTIFTQNTLINIFLPSIFNQIHIFTNTYHNILNIIIYSVTQPSIFYSNMSQQKQVTQATVVIMLWKVIQLQRQRSQQQTMQCLLNEQKLIHLSMMCLQKKTIKAVPFNLSQEIINFVLKINKITMENFKEENQCMDLKLMTKAVDLLMTPYVGRYVDTAKNLGSIKILTFNNLACIYKKKKKFALAVKAVSYAIQIEQFLFKNDEKGQKYQIIQTYLNKAAILSQMTKHEKAIQEILKAKKIVDLIQKQVIKQVNEAENQEEKKRIEQKKYYGLYMKMVINYNMGVQKQHMKLTQSAGEYYKNGRKLAVQINNPYMIKKFDAILNKITAVR